MSDKLEITKLTLDSTRVAATTIICKIPEVTHSYSVSNKGFIVRNRGEVVLKTKLKSGRSYVRLAVGKTNGGNTKYHYFDLSTIIYCTFHGLDYSDALKVSHRNSDIKDNRIENLILS